MEMVEIRLELLSEISADRFASFVVEGYYEVLKELATAMLILDGYKAEDHVGLIAYLGGQYSQWFDESEIGRFDNLRKLRNRIAYEGFAVEETYLRENREWIIALIAKLRRLVAGKL